MDGSPNVSPDEMIVLKRLLTNSSVEGIIVANNQGHIQYTSLDNNITFFICSKLLSFGRLARSVVRDIDPSDDLVTFRLRTRNKEMLIATPNNGTQAIALQNINSLPRIERNHSKDDENFAYERYQQHEDDKDNQS